MDSAHKRAEQLRSFKELCDLVGFTVELFQMKIASALLGSEREKLITLPRKNGKSRVVGTFAAWHLLNTPEAQAVVVANSKEQAEIIDRYARQVAMHPAVEQQFEPRFRELRGPDGSTLTVKSADAGRLLGLTPTLVLYRARRSAVGKPDHSAGRARNKIEHLRKRWSCPNAAGSNVRPACGQTQMQLRRKLGAEPLRRAGLIQSAR